MIDRFVEVGLSLFPLILLERRLNVVVGVFGILRSVIVSGAGIAFLFVTLS